VTYNQLVSTTIPNAILKVINKDNLEELNRYAEKSYPVHKQSV